MVWLVTHMWVALLGAAFLGLLFGWSFRGILLKGKSRQAVVERDVAQTELDQAKAEIDSLYAAQRKAPEDDTPQVAAVVSSPSEQEEREAKLRQLGEELAKSKEEIEALRSEVLDDKTAVTAGAAALAGAGAAAVIAGGSNGEGPRLDDDLDQADATLEWRNRYLESRVRSLETQVHESSNAAVAVEVETEDETPTEPTGQPPVVVEGEESPEQELARLRWRNRYLEGRVAYYEGGEGEVEVEAGSNGHGGLAAAAGAAVATAASALVSDDESAEASESDDVETAADAVLHALENEEVAIDPVDPEKPDTLDKPRGTSGDDLTEISGIGPKIQDVLHEMGVYHFDQVADWSAENVAWVDEQLSFSGRIDREEWVSQAKALTEAVAEDA